MSKKQGITIKKEENLSDSEEWSGEDSEDREADETLNIF